MVKINEMGKLLLVILGTMIPSFCWAHQEQDGTGFIQGLVHPVLGIDHLLAMISVGVVSAQLGGRSIWLIPATFVCSMVVGGIFGVYQIPLPLGELGVAVSVIVLGASIVIANKNTSPLLINIFVIFFGIFHGHAHGMEMPQSASPAFYTLGFLLSTALLHISGIAIREVAAHKDLFRKALRYIGASIAGMGLLIFLKGLNIVS